MSKSDYTGINMGKQSNYTIVVSPENERDSFNISLDIAREYVKKTGPPKCVVLSNLQNGFKIIPYYSVQTFKTGTIRVADRSREPENVKVIGRMLNLMKNSLIVIDDNFIVDEEVSEKILSVTGKAQDYIIHRNEIKLLDAEIDYVRKVYSQIENHDGKGNFIPEKNIILRLHDYQAFPFSIETLISLIEYFGEMHGWNILVAYFVARKRTVLFSQQVMDICKENDENPADFINQTEFKKRIKNHTYYNIITGLIMDEDKPFVERCATELAQILRKTQQKK